MYRSRVHGQPTAGSIGTFCYSRGGKRLRSFIKPNELCLDDRVKGLTAVQNKAKWSRPIPLTKLKCPLLRSFIPLLYTTRWRSTFHSFYSSLSRSVHLNKPKGNSVCPVEQEPLTFNHSFPSVFTLNRMKLLNTKDGRPQNRVWVRNTASTLYYILITLHYFPTLDIRGQARVGAILLFIIWLRATR